MNNVRASGAGRMEHERRALERQRRRAPLGRALVDGRGPASPAELRNSRHGGRGAPMLATAVRSGLLARRLRLSVRPAAPTRLPARLKR